MIVKPWRDRAEDLAALEALAKRADCPARTRAEIETEMRKIRAGQRGEKDAAYGIDFFLAPSEKWAVIHDLRIDWQGRVAQIDHLLVNRVLDIWLCESKHFHDGVAINEHGEFTRFFQGKPRGMESPIEQNRRHQRVLESLLGSSVLPLPTRLGVPLRPVLRNAVLVSADARITRPKQPFPGLHTVIKADQLRAAIDKAAESMGVADTLLAATRIVGADALGEFARSIAKLHRPLQADWAARFGMGKATPAPVSFRVDAEPSTSTLATAAIDTAGPKLSTSKLAAKLGLGSAGALLVKLAAEGLLVQDGDGYA